MRLVFSYGLSKRLFTNIDGKNPKAKKEDAESLILNFDALTITEEIKRTRHDKISSRSPKEKLLIHMCYLLTERFTKVHDSIFRLLKAFT